MVHYISKKKSSLLICFKQIFFFHRLLLKTFPRAVNNDEVVSGKENRSQNLTDCIMRTHTEILQFGKKQVHKQMVIAM